MSSNKKRNLWLEAGLQILTREDASKLTTENLVSKTGKTKGSFYHHFGNHGSYARELLEYWTETYTLQIIEKSSLGSTPNEKLKTLVQSTLKIPRKTELAIRAWALRNAIVRKSLEEIDKKRLDYLAGIFYSVSGDKKRSQLKAFKIYSAFIGYQQLAGHISGNKSPYITELFEIANYEMEN